MTLNKEYFFYIDIKFWAANITCALICFCGWYFQDGDKQYIPLLLFGVFCYVQAAFENSATWLFAWLVITGYSIIMMKYGIWVFVGYLALFALMLIPSWKEERNITGKQKGLNGSVN